LLGRYPKIKLAYCAGLEVNQLNFQTETLRVKLLLRASLWRLRNHGRSARVRRHIGGFSRPHCRTSREPRAVPSNSKQWRDESELAHALR
jgi:hypothetical protein